jgi:hypothetical protein
MNAREKSTSSQNRPTLLRAAATVALVAGAAGSVALTLYTGRHNASWLLPAMFAAWVLSPFAALAWAALRSCRWAALTSAALHWVTLAAALGSLALYARAAMGPTGIRATRVFLVVPPASLLLIAIVLGAAALIGRRRKQLGGR